MLFCFFVYRYSKVRGIFGFSSFSIIGSWLEMQNVGFQYRFIELEFVLLGDFQVWWEYEGLMCIVMVFCGFQFKVLFYIGRYVVFVFVGQMFYFQGKQNLVREDYFILYFS